MSIWWATLIGSTILLAGAVIYGYRLTMRNRALLRELGFLQTLLDTIPDQIYFKDTQSRFLRVSRGVAKTLGVASPDDLVGKCDADFFQASDAEAFRVDDQKVISSREPLRDRIERGTVNGVETWMSTTKAPLFDRNGKAIGLVGISRDITDRLRAEENLCELVAKARCILWNARVTRKNGKFNWRIDFHSSEQLRKELGLKQEEWTKHIHPDQLKKMDEVSQNAMINGADGYNQEFWVHTHSGDVRWINEDVRIAKITENEWDLVGVALDTTDRKIFEQQLAAANAKLARLANEDSLTGLINRRAILEVADAEWARWRRFGVPFSIMILDIDNFKKINDIYSHQDGDLALQHTANQLKGSIRKLDSIGRYGGEEFVIVLPGTTLDGAKNLAEKILTHLRATPLALNKAKVDITVSIGVAVSLESDKNVAALIHRADCAMIVAKRTGKNRAVMAGDSKPSNSSMALQAVG